MAGLTAPATRRLLAAGRGALARVGLHHRAPDYYAILGVASQAPLDDIKFAYFNMAKKFHPENNRTLDAKQMFALVAEAYDVLSDQERRSRYDETGLSEDRFGGTSGGPGRQTSDSTYTAEQMYQTIFGRSAQEAEQEEHAHEDFAESHAGSGVSREYIVQVSAEEAVRGVRVGVQLRQPGVCDKCQGSRAELGTTGLPCPYCEGTGQETVRSGHITARKTCSYCQGEKIFIKFKCIECEGVGRKMFDLYHPVDVPPGTLHGEVLRMEVDKEYLDRVSGFDWDGLDGRSTVTTLFVTVDVAASDQFSLDGRDIVACLELGPALALLGGAVPFPSPLGRCLQVTVRPGTPSHTAVVVPGEGLPGPDSLAGDLVLRTAIRAPGQLTWRQARIWRRFAETEAGAEGVVGLVEGVASELDHRLGVNVITADKVSNLVVKVVRRKGFDEAILERVREKMGLARPVAPEVSRAAHHTPQGLFGH